MDINHRIMLEESPDPADMELLNTGLRAYNTATLGPSGFRRMAFFIRDEECQIAAGLLAGTFWGWLHLDTLWVREDLRGKGYGSALLRAAESEALKRGVNKAYLDTFSFQAPGFYQKHGYAVFGELKDVPEGHSHLFMSKVLQPAEGPIPPHDPIQAGSRAE